MTSGRAGHDAIVWVADGEIFPGRDYGMRLGERLRARGLRVLTEDLTRPSPQVPQAGLHVISGGATAVSTQSGWMPGGLALTRALIDGARAGAHTLFGVCLGSQMIAETLWPGSVQGAARIKTGLADIAWCPPGQAEPDKLVVPLFHYQEIVRSAIGDDAVLVGEDSLMGVQGICFGERLWGVQFHPELEPGDLRQLVEHHRQTIETYHYSAEAALQSVNDRENDWQHSLFDRILDDVLAVS
jgi:GMP synthase-like glutamine amidotransferase